MPFYIRSICKNMPEGIQQDSSGGQQQLIAIARAIVTEPRLLLMDEPLSNIDVKLREDIRQEIRRIQQETQITTVFT